MAVFYDNAPIYAGMGFRIAPVAQGEKHPCIPDWRNQATSDMGIIQRWRSSYTSCNIGAVMGPFKDAFILALDFDVKHPPLNGILTRQRWELLHGLLPETLKQLTPSGGETMFYIVDREGLGHHSPTNGDKGSGIDIQADGAFIMLAPSTFNGKEYRFVDPACPIAHATEAVYDFIKYVVETDAKGAESNAGGPTSDPNPVDAAIKEHELRPLIEALNKIPCDKVNYEDWIHVGAALFNSGATVDVWDQWSQTDASRYHDGECEKKWATFAASKLNWNAGTIYKMANQYQQGVPAKAGIPHLIRACDVPYEPPRWLIAPYLQRGKGALFQGDNGTGKTAAAMGITSHVTTGVPLLGMKVATPGDVLILSVEDDLPVLRGRLEANGADLSKCHFMGNAAGLTFNSPEVEAAIAAVNARLVIFDPFQAFLGAKVDMFRSNETRPELARLFDMCNRHDCACLIISHMAKNRGDKSPVNKSLGSVDIPAAMRSILELTDDPNHPGQKVMVHIKCSNAPKGPSIAFTIGDRGGVHWTGFSPMTPDDLTIVRKRRETGIDYEQEPLVKVFKALMRERPAGGFWSYNDVQSVGSKVLGFPPFDGVGDLKRKLDGGLARELQTRESLIVTHSATSRGNKRGLTIERYSKGS